MADPGVAAARPRVSACQADQYAGTRRRSLLVAVGLLLREAGFDSTSRSAVETLTEMMQSYISEIGRSARAFCEHTARTQPTLPDVIVCLCEMGFDVEALPDYARHSHSSLPAPAGSHAPAPARVLPTGVRRSRPAHIPQYYPELPDPHTYIRTPTYREPVSGYQALRDRVSARRRDVETSLTRFVAKTGTTPQSLFAGHSDTFPLIACTPSLLPYLGALLPSELEGQGEGSSEEGGGDGGGGLGGTSEDSGPLSPGDRDSGDGGAGAGGGPSQAATPRAPAAPPPPPPPRRSPP
uniref:Transcription initiation factor TFIID subunit 8 n=1 Tax=Petromyzon marinus TaxID=7757 RepID=A0AAJ7XL56_PETMA|nr:transcription initiation factor TFIID subunit 8 [Petromyzon marinus]